MERTGVIYFHARGEGGERILRIDGQSNEDGLSFGDIRCGLVKMHSAP